MPLALAFLTLLASITLTYLFCVRPMRTGRGCGKRGATGTQPNSATGCVSAQDLQAARDDIAALNADASHPARTDPPPGAKAAASPAVAHPKPAPWNRLP
jgi:hypothetical protein